MFEVWKLTWNLINELYSENVSKGNWADIKTRSNIWKNQFGFIQGGQSYELHT